MKRILLKISGEALSSENKSIDPGKAQKLAEMIIDIKKLWSDIVLVLGWGNIYRGSKLIQAGLDGADSHNMSMLSTVFNAVTLKNFLEKLWCECVIMDALRVEFLEKYSAIKARKYISEGKIVISSSWSGSPFFTTDTAWVLRALELHCDCMIKLTKVDGVYDRDPMKDTSAQKIDEISYDTFISQDLKILDQTGIIMARDNNLPLYVTKLDDLESIRAIIEGKKSGTKIS